MYNLAKILRAIMQAPEHSNLQIAKTIGVSQPTVSRARRRLEKGIVAYETVPNLRKLGFEIFAVTVFKHHAPESGNVVYVANVQEGILVFSVHRNYTDYYRFVGRREIHSSFLVVEKPMKPLSFKKISFSVVHP